MTWREYRGREIGMCGLTYYVVGLDGRFGTIHAARAAIDALEGS